MPKADRVHSTPPTSTTTIDENTLSLRLLKAGMRLERHGDHFQVHSGNQIVLARTRTDKPLTLADVDDMTRRLADPVADPTRRLFLTQAAGIAAAGTALALAAIPPTPAAAAPTGALDPANAGPALRAATRALGDADDRLKQARAAFDAADKLPEDWRRLNPQPTAGRALKRWNRRREREYRYSVVMPRWQALLAAEDDFRDAMMAVAMIKSLDMGELALKACLSSVYDEVRLSWPSGAPIGSSVAIDLLALTLRATS